MFGIKTKILTYYRRKIVPYFGPEMVRIQPIGFKCNHNCPMCWRSQMKDYKQFIRDPNNQDLSIVEYRKLIRKLPFTVKHVEVVGGGEPLLFREFLELSRLIKRKKFFASLITNGALLNQEISSNLVELGWDWIRISFNAGTKKRYIITNGADDFAKVVDNIRDLINIRGKKAYPKISLHYVIQRDNACDVGSFINLANNLKVDEISFDSLLGFSLKKVQLRQDDYDEAIHQLKINKDCLISNNIDYILSKLTDKSMRKKEYFNDKYCSIIQRNIDIGGNGEVVPCCLAFRAFESLNIKNFSLYQIWRKYAPFRKELSEGKFRDFCYKSCNYDLPVRDVA